MRSLLGNDILPDRFGPAAHAITRAFLNMSEDSNNQPLFSIVSPALNCLRFLPRNVASVRQQGLPSGQIEHWIIDGNSTDGTREWLASQTELRWISEPDRSLSEAVNKGLSRATGKWILWLNADDELAPNSLSAFLEVAASHPEQRVFCGRQKVFRYDGSLEITSPSWDYNLGELLGTRTAINQASTFVHREVYETVGLLDGTYRYAMDYEWVVRAMHQYTCQPIDIVLSHYHRRPGSIMDVGIAQQHREFLRVRRHYGLKRASRADLVFRWYLLIEPLRRITWLRRLVRNVKRLLGREPRHPIPEQRLRQG